MQQTKVFSLSRAHLKSFIIPALKLVIGGGLVYWLIDSGKLDIKQLAVFLESWQVTLSAILHFALVGVMLGGIRLRLLLKGLGVSIRLGRISQFQMIGLFFNVAMPGAVGGDLVKGLYVIKDNKNQNRTKVMMAILIDRISGMTGLFTIGVLAALFNLSTVWENDLIRPTIVSVILLFVGMVALHFFAIRKTSDERDWILKILNRHIPGFSLLKKIYMAFREFKNQPLVLFNAWFMSLLIQFFTLLYFVIITAVLMPDFVNWSGLATVFPIGIFTTALPISPGGLGVGHLAFERLYELIGYTGGANVFNIYILGYMMLCVVGVIPYLTIKKDINIGDVSNLEQSTSV